MKMKFNVYEETFFKTLLLPIYQFIFSQKTTPFPNTIPELKYLNSVQNLLCSYYYLLFNFQIRSLPFLIPRRSQYYNHQQCIHCFPKIKFYESKAKYEGFENFLIE